MQKEELILDQAILDENTMSNKPLQLELFTLFFEQAKTHISGLQAAIDAGSTQDWRMICHGIKGACRSLGFTHLAVLATRAEAGTPNIAQYEAICEALEDIARVTDMRDAA